MLVVDEMHIKHDLVYDKHSGALIGFVDLGNTNNQILEFERDCLLRVLIESLHLQC